MSERVAMVGFAQTDYVPERRDQHLAELFYPAVVYMPPRPVCVPCFEPAG